MSATRSITSSAAREHLGEILGSLATDGSVQITRNGRPVGVLSMPAVSAKPTSKSRLAELASKYSSGSVAWHKISDETGASYGELLLELARQELPLPRINAQKRPEQMAIFDNALRRAARQK